MARIDQLIYTWSEVGLSGRTAGFRIRAASQELSDARSPRYRGLERYLSYDLPPGMRASSVRAADAPVCLALIDAEEERILVRREMLDVESVGRPGAYLTHLLAGLPAHFSARDAILLWHSDLWVTTKNPLSPRQLLLDPLPEQRLFSRETPAWQIASMDNFRASLRLALAHFLRSSSPGQLALCGSSETIAALIWGVTQSLPLALLAGMTFSTYTDGRDSDEETIAGFFSERFLPPGESSFNVDTAASRTRPEVEGMVDQYISFAVTELCRRIQAPRQREDQLASLIEQADKQDVRDVAALLRLFETYQQEQEQKRKAAEQQRIRERERSRPVMPAIQPVPLVDREVQSNQPATAVPYRQQPAALAAQNSPQQDARSGGFMSQPPQRPVPISTRAKNATGALVSQFRQELAQIRPQRVLYRVVLLSLCLNLLLLGALIISLIARAPQPNSPGVVASTHTPSVPRRTPPVPVRGTVTPIPILTDDVTFSAISSPSAAKNAAFTFSVAVKNSGSSTWNVQQHYQLKCIPNPDPGTTTDQDCPAEQQLALVTASVAPGAVYTFVFQFQSPGPVGTHTIKVQMFRDQTPFGKSELLSFKITA
ncbi:MAG TPA: hypothetical protein VKY19_17205 [Ktedonosporobacter sp.]|nr:hypothetical protein [Ktedonosporobacter sp.]